MKTLWRNILLPGIFLGVVAFVSGCSHTPPTHDTQALQNEINKMERQVAELAKSNVEKDKTLREYERQLHMKRREPAAAREFAFRSGVETQVQEKMLPPDARSGQCFARVFMPPAYRTYEERALKRGASEKVEIVPARYEWGEQKVLVKEASQRMEVIPAKYGWVQERVLVKSAASRLTTIPAKYEWKEERVLVKSAHTVWKKGEGAVEKVDNATGEIMCLVTVPASYRTVRKKVMTRAPATREVAIPAEYKVMKKQVMLNPPSQRLISIPASYKTVKVRRMVAPPSERKIQIPAEYQTVTRTEMVKEGRMEWSQILCETNTTPELIRSVQISLSRLGHDPGPIDGVIGHRTEAALKSFQKAKRLGQGGLTFETIKSLGISI